MILISIRWKLIERMESGREAVEKR